MVNGIDMTDPKQTFSKEEWEKLKGQLQYIWDRRADRATQDAMVKVEVKAWDMKPPTSQQGLSKPCSMPPHC